MYVLEDARLQRHFTRVLAELSARDVSHLTRGTRSRRHRLLGTLVAYADRRRFPRNPDFARRTPYFIDANGTRCAMAHLIEQTGERELVERVATTRNNAFVRQLQGDLALRAWLASSGLTAREAARIQPAYCFITKGDTCFCEAVAGAEGVVDGTVTAVATANRVMVMVQAVHGDTGAITVGEEITVGGVANNAQVGDAVLVPVALQQGVTAPLSLMRLDGSAVDLSCAFDVPALAKADAIDAMLATSCTDELAQIDATWGESQCEEEQDDGGCSVAGGGSPLVAVLAAALWSRRGR